MRATRGLTIPTSPFNSRRNRHGGAFTARRSGCKSDRPSKPYDGFPLYAHPSGKWAKKIRGEFYYFGQWAQRIGGKLVRVEGDGWKDALASYKAQAEALHAGRKPRILNVEGLTIAECCDRFLTAKFRKMQSGELTQRSFAEYKSTTDLIVAAFGKQRLVDDLASDDFEPLRATMAERWGVERLGKFIGYIRSTFKYAFDSGLIIRPVRFGPEFEKPSKAVMRRHKAARPKRLFTADEIRQLLDGKTVTNKVGESKQIPGASVQLRAMILLGVNAAMGNTDVARLPKTALDFKNGFVNFPRQKTGIERRCSLWPETVQALLEAMAERPTMVTLCSSPGESIRAGCRVEPTRSAWNSASCCADLGLIGKVERSTRCGTASGRLPTPPKICGRFVW